MCVHIAVEMASGWAMVVQPYPNTGRGNCNMFDDTVGSLLTVLRRSQDPSPGRVVGRSAIPLDETSASLSKQVPCR